MKDSIGRIGIWSLELRYGDKDRTAQAAAELDELGFAALRVPGGVGGDLFGDLDHLLAATKRTTIATGILNIWKHEPGEVVRWWKGLPTDQQERVLLGLGVSHAHAVGDAWKKPLSVMRDYLSKLADAGLPPASVCLAALGPKMLELAAGGRPEFIPISSHPSTGYRAQGSGTIEAGGPGTGRCSGMGSRQSANSRAKHFRSTRLIQTT